MRLRMLAALAISLVTATPAVAEVDRRVAPQVARLMAEADASKARKDDPGALAAAKAALAAAEARKGDERSQFEALDHLTGFWPSGDLEGSFTLFDRLAPLAARVEGADAYRAHAALSGRNLLAFFLGKPGASLDAITAPLERAIATARTDKERMDTGAVGLMLGQFYINAGQRPKAQAVIDRAAALFETTPATPIATFPGGLTTLAQIYAIWGDWSRSLSYADRAIVAHDEVDRRRTVNAAAPLIHRGNALNAMQWFEDAEVAYRTAVALTDTAPDPFIKASVLSAIGRFYVSTGRDALAVPLLTRAADLATSFPPGAGSRMAALTDLYGIAMRRTDFAEALRLMQLAQDDVEKRTFRNSLSHGVVLLALASAALPLGKLDDARKAIEAAAPMVEKGDRPGGQRQADLRIVRGRLALREGRIDAGVAELQAGIAMFSALPNTDPNAAAAAEATLADALLQQAAPGAAWASGRRGAQRITDAIIRRSISAGAGSVLSDQEMNVLDTALKAAWMAQHHAMPVTATPPPATTTRTL